MSKIKETTHKRAEIMTDIVDTGKRGKIREMDIGAILLKYGRDILLSRGMQSEKNYIQHGSTSVFVHSVGVAYLSVWLARRLSLRLDERALVRGALLHDYFLYDWHVPDPVHRLHGFRHARFAQKNADRDFKLGEVERDIILRHMFPLNPIPPRYVESILVCAADKICAVCEMISYDCTGGGIRPILRLSA